MLLALLVFPLANSTSPKISEKLANSTKILIPVVKSERGHREPNEKQVLDWSIKEHFCCNF